MTKRKILFIGSKIHIIKTCQIIIINGYFKITVYDDYLTGFYDMYFTSYKKNFPLSHIVLKGNVICGYTESSKCDCKAGEKHLEQMLQQDGYKHMTVKIFDNLDKYTDRLGQLLKLETEESKNRQGMIQMFYSISL